MARRPDSPITCQDLVKYYGPLCAVNGISFEVRPGEIFGLLGPNGAGKTTIISILTTLESPSSGEVSIFGRSVQKDPLWCKKRCGAVPQELLSHGIFTVEEILHFHSGFYGIRNNTAWIEELLERLKLASERNKRVAQLSGGMKRRLLIAKALVHQPPLILLDEPTAGVDIDLRTDLWEFIRDLNRQGATILLTTHYLEEAERLCNRVGVIDRGHLLRIGETRDLISELTMREVVLWLSEEIEEIKSPYLIERSGRRLLLRLPSGVDFRALLETLHLTAHQIQDVEVHEGTLEEAVRHILNHKED